MWVERIKYYFSYLTQEYGFRIILEKEELFSPESFRVEYQSDVCKVIIHSDRWEVHLELVEPNKYGEIPLWQILRVLDPGSESKLKMCENLDFEEELKNQSILLLKYCLEILKGNFNIRKKLNFPSIG